MNDQGVAQTKAAGKRSETSRWKIIALIILMVLSFPLFPIWLWLLLKRLSWNRTTKIVGTFAVLLPIVLGVVSLQTANGMPILTGVNSPTNSATVTIEGAKAFPNADIKLYRNDEIVDVLRSDGAGNFSVRINLTEGENRLVASATNDQGKSKTSATLRVIYDNTPPILNLDDTSQDVINSMIELRGSSEDGAEITATTDGVDTAETTVKGTTFNVQVKLQEGENVISLVATDRAGNKSENKLINVRYTKPVKDDSSPSISSTETDRATSSQSNTSDTTVSVEPREMSTIDKLWKGLDASLKTRDGYDIKYDDQIGTVVLTREPVDYINETDIVRTAYETMIKFGREAFRIEGVKGLDMALFTTTSDSYGNSERRKGVQLTISKEEFQKYDWDTLKYKVVSDQLKVSAKQWVYPGISTNVDWSQVKLLDI